jgi:hypothetical protein
MTTQPLYFGGEMDAFIPSDNSVTETTFGGSYDATYSRCSIQVPSNSTLKSIQFAAQTGKVYFNFCVLYAPANGGESDLFWVLNDAGDTVFKVTANRNSSSTSLYKMYRLSAPGTFTAIGSGVTVNHGFLQYCTVALDKPNGIATLYIAGSQQDTGTGSFGAITNFARAVHGPTLGAIISLTAYWSQMFASTSPTIGQRLYTIVEDANGAVQDWTGAVTDINELVCNDATGITSTTNGNVSTYLKSGLALSGVVLGIGTSARFNVGATGPQNLQNVLRVSGANYTSPSTLGATGFAPAQYMWMTNPATSTAWTPGAGSAVEWGVEAIT